MPEETPLVNSETGIPLEGSPGSSTGSGSEGSQGDLQSQLAALEGRRAGFQSLADRRYTQIQQLEAEKMATLEELQTQISAMNSKLAGLGTGPSVEDIAAQLVPRLAAAQALAGYKAQLGEKYKGVNVDSLSGQTPEELEVQAKAKFDESEGLRSELRAEAEVAVRAKYEAQYGTLADPNGDAMDQGDGGPVDGGQLTVEKFMAMTDAEVDKLPDETWKVMMAQVNAMAGDA